MINRRVISKIIADKENIENAWNPSDVIDILLDCNNICTSIVYSYFIASMIEISNSPNSHCTTLKPHANTGVDTPVSLAHIQVRITVT